MLEPGGVSSCKTVRSNNPSTESPGEGEEAKSREAETKSISFLTVRDSHRSNLWFVEREESLSSLTWIPKTCVILSNYRLNIHKLQ